MDYTRPPLLWHFFTVSITALGCAGGPGPGPAPLNGLAAVPPGRVRIRGGFWGRRLETHRAVTIPHALDCLEKNGHVTNFDKAAGRYDGPLRGHHAFDSDLHKALEGALYTLRHRDDPALRARVASIIDRVLAARQDDGFLISCWIVRNAEKRWENLRIEHQLYNAGHFFEMAVAHHALTGDRRVLDAARRFADHIDGIFGPGKRYDVGGHEEVELALVRLYRATGERRYLDLARFFLDERGHAHGTARRPFDPATAVLPPRPAGPMTAEQRRAYRRARNSVRTGRMQDHKPLVEQAAAVGHAVRAGYVYAAMADIARFSDAPAYARAIRRLWRDVVGRKMYITGGLGTAQYHDEGFGDPYLLPNRTYCESCAAIAHVLWQHRMNLLEARTPPADVMELTLYNGAISGIAITGDAFFYRNPLASRGARRRPWIGLACCPTNLARIIPQVGRLACARENDAIYVNLYLAGTISFRAGGTPVTLTAETAYPWDGRVRLIVEPAREVAFDLCLRIPGWARGRPVPGDLYRFGENDTPPVTLSVCGRAVDAAPADDGYIHLRRRWTAGDAVALEMPMPVRRVYAHENVAADRGKVALMRGPIVYCLEAVDHPGVDVSGLSLPAGADLRAEHRPGLLGGVTVLRGTAHTAGGAAVAMTAVPYYAWANRARGAMTVWIGETGGGNHDATGKVRTAREEYR